MSQELPIMESFLTIQGEGYHSGKPAFFIRTGGCDVGCSWCDVKESWEAENHLQNITALQKLSLEMKVNGSPYCEPAMYKLNPLVKT